MSVPPQGEPSAGSLVLIRQAKAGDADALNALFRKYSPRVLQIVRLRLSPSLRGKLESQDIVQDAFTRAVKSFESFEVRHEGAFLHWMGELVRNAINDRYDQFRAQKRDARLENPIEPAERTDSSISSSLPGNDPTPSRVLENREDILRLSDALDKLPPEARDVIIFRDLEEQSFAEIGELTGRTEDAARMFYARAKAKLTGIFQDPG